MGIWEKLLETYDTYCESGRVAPVAHTRIIMHIGVVLDKESNVLVAAKGKQSILAPCTIDSECRTRNVAPHLLHDNVSYIVPGVDDKRHRAYLEQLGAYVSQVNDPVAQIIYDYVKRETIADDLKHLVDLADRKNKGLVIGFGIRDIPETLDASIDTIWTDYYLSTLPINGICGITGQPDHIPGKYPGNIRHPSDMAKLFVGKDTDPLCSMPKIKAGYIASQKIIHMLQAMHGGWVEQDELPLTDCVLRVGDLAHEERAEL